MLTYVHRAEQRLERLDGHAAINASAAPVDDAIGVQRHFCTACGLERVWHGAPVPADHRFVCADCPIHEFSECNGILQPG